MIFFWVEICYYRLPAWPHSILGELPPVGVMALLEGRRPAGASCSPRSPIYCYSPPAGGAQFWHPSKARTTVRLWREVLATRSVPTLFPISKWVLLSLQPYPPANWERPELWLNLVSKGPATTREEGRGRSEIVEKKTQLFELSPVVIT